MTKTSLVSVVLPAFNAATFLRGTIDSVLRQTHANLELIIVDDGSEDETNQIASLAAASDARVRVLSQANSGVAAARNAGIAVARGEFIAPIDADDRWDPTKLERQVACMRDGGPRVGFVYSWWLLLDQRDRVLDTSPKWDVQGEVLQSLIEVNFVGCASVPLFRRECLEEVGGYSARLREEGAQGCEDWDLSLRVAERYHVGVVPAFLVGYRRRADSMSASSEKMARSQQLLMAEWQRRQPGIAEDVFGHSRRQFGFHLASIDFWSRSYGRALRFAMTTPPTLVVAAVPHVVRAAAARVLNYLRGAPEAPIEANSFSSYAGPPSIIPFEKLYARRWIRRADRLASWRRVGLPDRRPPLSDSPPGATGAAASAAGKARGGDRAAGRDMPIPDDV